MQRALVLTAAGGLTLYLTYLLVHGETPRVVQRVVSTVPRPKQDATLQPRTSGSASSIVSAIARSGQDPHFTDRPTKLGGDAANTGTKQEHPTARSLTDARGPGNALSDAQIQNIIGGMDWESVFDDELAPVVPDKNSEDMKEDRCTHFAANIHKLKEGERLQRKANESKRYTEKQFLEAGYNKDQAAFLQQEHCG